MELTATEKFLKKGEFILAFPLAPKPEGMRQFFGSLVRLSFECAAPHFNIGKRRTCSILCRWVANDFYSFCCSTTKYLQENCPKLNATRFFSRSFGNDDALFFDAP